MSDTQTERTSDSTGRGRTAARGRDRQDTAQTTEPSGQLVRRHTDNQGDHLARRQDQPAARAQSQAGRKGAPALRLDMDLDVDVQLKAKIEGDITLSIL
jgi:hypothetical protein